MYNRGDTPNDNVQAFLEYAKSSAADNLIAKAGFIDLGIRRREQTLSDPLGQQLMSNTPDAFEGQIRSELLGYMNEYDRLSTTFRFRADSSKLDERGNLDIECLTAYLETQPASTRVKLMNFTDNVGAFEPNRTLAIDRAASIKTLFEERAAGKVDGISISSAGFGPEAPFACNTNSNGKAKNQRVEVWISK